MLSLLLLAMSAEPAREVARPIPPAAAGVGRYIPDATFTDIAGKPGKLSDYKAKLLVVAVTDTGCPVCTKSLPALARLEGEFPDVPFLFVNPTASDALADIQKAIDANKLRGRYIHDTAGTLTATLGVRSSADVFVLDSARTVVYRGALSDQYGVGTALDAPKHEYLKAALTHLLAGRSPDVAATTVPGCAVDPGKGPPMAVTYHNRVSRIVRQHCQECHRAGGVGPFALDTYEQVAARKGTLKRVVERGTMPPWFAAPNHGSFLNDRTLPPADKADLLAWLASDLPKGDPADAPVPAAYTDGWQIGKPDAVFAFSKPVKVKAEGTMPYQIVTVETHLDEDKWVWAVEVRPSARAVVHHVIMTVSGPAAGGLGGLRNRFPGAGIGLRADPDDERQGYFAVYVPGNSTSVLPDGYARKLPKGAVLRFQMHYTPNGTATEDRTEVGMIFAKEPPKFDVRVAGLTNPRLSIPPGDDNHKQTARLVVPFDATIRAFVPHMHVRGKACKYEMTTSDGKTTMLLEVPKYDFNWQLRYVLAEPLSVRKGNTLTYTAWYDNSDKNPANPDPTATVKWGQQTTDEMHLGYIEYVMPR